MALKVTTPPASTPVTTAEAKTHMRIDHDGDDAYIAGLIAGARDFLQSVCGKTFFTTTYTLKLDRFPTDDYIDMPMPPLATVTSISYEDTAGDTQTFSSASYTVDTYPEPGRIYVDRSVGWPSVYDQRNAVTIVYTAGYATVPDNIKQAVLLLTAEWYENRENGVVGTIYTPTPSLRWLIDNIKLRGESNVYACGLTTP